MSRSICLDIMENDQLSETCVPKSGGLHFPLAENLGQLTKSVTPPSNPMGYTFLFAESIRTREFTTSAGVSCV